MKLLDKLETSGCKKMERERKEFAKDNHSTLQFSRGRLLFVGLSSYLISRQNQQKLLHQKECLNRKKDHFFHVQFQPAYLCATLLQSCPTLCDLMNCSPPVSSIQGILQARMLESVSMLYFWGSSQQLDQACISCIGRHVLYHQCHMGSPLILAYSAPLHILVRQLSSQIFKNILF